MKSPDRDNRGFSCIKDWQNIREQFTHTQAGLRTRALSPKVPTASIKGANSFCLQQPLERFQTETALVTHAVMLRASGHGAGILPLAGSIALKAHAIVLIFSSAATGGASGVIVVNFFLSHRNPPFSANLMPNYHTWSKRYSPPDAQKPPGGLQEL